MTATRSPLPYRTVVAARTAEDAVARLAGRKAGLAATEPNLGVVFAGQGAQWAGMGGGLVGGFPLFGRVFGEVL
ncbi:hypothetical protein, partial [Kitasatospora aureofaciens]|uniref:hypothetical protein n=1 Tax=Kitasatospora aureofaciens TaxID=1894 RepID=UPI001F3AD077